MAFNDNESGIPPMELAEYLVKRKSFLPKEVRVFLQNSFAQDDGKIGGNSDFDLHEEIMEQIRVAKILRSSAFPEGQKTVASENMRDAKEALTASTSLIKALTTTLEKIYNQDKVRTLQQTLIEALKETDPVLQNRFMTLLRERLK